MEYRAEGMIPELEQLEHIRLFEKREIRYGFIPIYIQSYTGVVILHIALYAGTFQQLGSSWLRFLSLCSFVLSLFGSITFQLVRYLMLGDENCPLYTPIRMLCVVDCTYVVTVRYSICIKTTREKKRFSAKGSRKFGEV